MLRGSLRSTTAAADHNAGSPERAFYILPGEDLFITGCSGNIPLPPAKIENLSSTPHI